MPALLFVLAASSWCFPTVVASPEDSPEVGSGALFRKIPGGGAERLPVVKMKVDLIVTGTMARGIVEQQFDNPSPDVIEAIYMFPLPERAGVDRMVMEIGDRRIAAVVKEKEEARATYERAKSEGRKGSLLEQRRPHLFTSSVANIAPGERISVRLEYVQEVEYRQGAFELSFPLTVTPVYRPGTASDSATPARASALDEDDCGEAAASTAAVLAALPRATLHVDIDAGAPLAAISSPSHDIVPSIGAGGHASVDLKGGATLADRDFRLQWKPRLDPDPRGIVMTEEREGERYAMAMVLPPALEEGEVSGLATETVFVIDVSGSMEGPSIVQARDALIAVLDRLRPDDTFALIAFSDHNQVFREEFLPADRGSLEEARGWVRRLSAGGGTEILPALERAMDMLGTGHSRRLRRIILVTDGAVGNETQVFARLQERLGSARLHVLGIGAAPNRYFMRKIAQFGHGLCDFIGSPQEVGDRMELFLGRLERPVMTDLALEWDGTPPRDVYPSRLPDLYAGEPLFVSFRFDTGAARPHGFLTGQVEGRLVRSELTVSDGGRVGSGIGTRWARAKVEDLTDSLVEGADPEQVRRDIVDVAMRFHLVSRYTSLVAVEETPSVSAAARAVRMAAASPLAGELPTCGTEGPLRVRIALLLVLTGVVFSALYRQLR